MPFVWINGDYADESAASVSVRDTGLLHGVGVFTTLRTAGGRCVRLDAHLARLRESCDAFVIPLAYKDADLETAAEGVLERNGLADARMRITVTRGVTEIDPVHGPHARPNVFITAAPFEPYPAEYYEKGLTTLVLDEQKLNPYDPQAGHKTLNYLSRLAALREANRRGAGEALWFNVHNFLQSGCVSNVFLVKDSVLVTPPTQAELRQDAARDATPYKRSNVLPGTTRAAVLAAAEDESIPVELRAVTIDDVLSADEVFLTNSVMSVMPVCRIERRAIGDEKPGRLTRQFAATLGR
ncbi:MAG TPA: aminotransferase class IV [Tepidisphaeraceae bacterium]|jgi:branched-chain amino acid aminotransferase